MPCVNGPERLHWPETEMAKKRVLSPMEKPLSPSQLYLERWSPGVLKDLFGTSSYNVILHNEEEEEPLSQPKHSPFRRPKRAQLHVSAASRKAVGRAVVLLRPREGYRDSSQSQLFSSSTRFGNNITVLGSPIGLTPRPIPRPQRSSQASSSRVRLPLLAKGGTARDGENTMKKLCILTAIKPFNVESEKTRFFKSDFTYNPQFEYSNPAAPQVLEKHNSASDRFLTQAVRIMELALQKYGNYEKFEQATGGNLLTKSRIWSHVKKYMEKEGCMGEIVVHLTDDLLSRASMTVVNGRPTLTINISTAREQWLEGMLRHEIGTHYFRGINNSQQPWNNGAGRKKLGLRPLNPTEEGLASIHSVLFRRDPTLWRAALLYYTVYQASRMSFSQLFHDLGRFVHDPNTRWDYCVRAKRGQTDTSQPGCFSKDQVYLDGILKILRHREKINFQLLTALGKVSYEDVERLKGLAVMEHVRIPHFLQDQSRYSEQLQKIMEVNQLTDEELRMLI
ncbi:putative tyrosine carboxypeptidase MATCAP2 isoform X2 [Salminus brasiliensis]|uniref:putative tyrosine carboxypeptidase MATCAP2 isoform X2 n=1 Tax=Salminus brasiliensis TaxID=930266 RepID=UPI003B830673